MLGEPFAHVLIVCVGPLPKFKSGNQFILTIMCASSHFSEAIPLRTIRTPNIVNECFSNFFHTSGASLISSV